MSSRPHGTWSRFAASLVALLAVALLIPAALLGATRVSLGTGSPLPGIGSVSEIRDWLSRELSTTEIIPVVLRSLLIVAWVLWIALMSSVASAFVASRPTTGHIRLPRLALFDGLAIWIATGLTVVSSLSPRIAIADTTFPAAYAPVVDADRSTGERDATKIEPVREGFERVETGESIEMFAQRTLGDASRWTEIWELGRGTVVDPDRGATWDEPWRLEGGWQLCLPARDHATPAPSTDGDAPSTDDASAQRTVEPGDSYWSIATDLLRNHLDREPTDSETLELVNTLIDRNAAHLRHTEPTVLHPGDLLDIDVDIDTPAAAHQPTERVVAPGDSYWSIAADVLWATTGERPAEADVFLLSQQLMLDNAERLGYADPALIHPGDIVRLQPEPAPSPTEDTASSAPRPAPSPTPPPAHEAPSSAGDDGETSSLPEPLPPAPEPVETIDTSTHDRTTLPEPTTPPSSSPSTGDTAPPLAVHPSASITDNTPTEHANSNVTSIGLLTGLTLLSAAGIGGLIRRRHAATRQMLRPGRRLVRPTPATQRAIEDVLYRDVSDVTWMDHELRLLAHLLDPQARRRMTIELVQLGAGRTLEVAFQQVADVTAPGSWVSIADRVWRLDAPHNDTMLAEVQDAPPVAPALVTLGESTAPTTLFLNLESAAGVNLSGEENAVSEWLANAMWEVAGRAVGEGSSVYLVADETFDRFQIPAGVERVDEGEALDLVDDLDVAKARHDAASMLSRRTGRWESWPSTMFVVATEHLDPRWDRIAAVPSVAVISTTHRFDHGLDLRIEDGTISIPSLGIEESAVVLTATEQLAIQDIIQAVDVHAVEDAPTATATRPADDAPVEIDDDWQPPTWPVMINVLGPPRAYRNGKPIGLTPQQLSALALIAIRREIPAHDFRRSIWGDEDDVSPERVRDMLSQLRKKVGGFRTIPKREDGVVCAGADLGSDTLVFEALTDRAATAPARRDELLRHALDLVNGRVLDYSSSDAAWWRWSEIAFGSTDWTARTTDVAATLAMSHLERSEPAAARDIAERGLIADPLNASLTELLMEAYADLGTLQSAQRVYESHDRSLDRADLGGASPETRRVLERLRSAAARPVDDSANVS